VNDTAIDREDQLLTINVLANDPTGATLFSLGALGAPAVTSVTTAGGALVTIVAGSLRYDPRASAFLNRLSQGETALDTFTYVARFADGSFGVATVSVTVQGVNDGPAFVSTAVSTQLTELAGQTAGAGQLSASGTLAFSDPDWHDTHTVSVALQTATPPAGLTLSAATLTALGSALTTNVVQDSLNGVNGTIGWNFNLADRLADVLGAGQVLTLAYLVTVRDSAAAVVSGTPMARAWRWMVSSALAPRPRLGWLWIRSKARSSAGWAITLR